MFGKNHDDAGDFTKIGGNLDFFFIVKIMRFMLTPVFRNTEEVLLEVLLTLNNGRCNVASAIKLL